MPRQSINDLKTPPEGYRPEKNLLRPDGKPRFQSKNASIKEDRERCSRLRKSIEGNDLSNVEKEKARSLLHVIEESIEQDDWPRTLASSRGARRWRRNPVGWLHYLHDCETLPSGHGIHAFTIFPPQGWRFSCEALDSVNPNRLLERFRRSLGRLGPVPGDGWLFAGLHSEFGFDSEGMGYFDFHLHGLVAGSMIERLQALRHTPSYGPGIYGRIKSAIEITHTRLHDPQLAISYCLQDWWPYSSFFDPEVNAMKRGRRSRIPEPHHTRVLLWMDNYTLRDLTLMVGLRVEGGELIRSGSVYINE